MCPKRIVPLLLAFVAMLALSLVAAQASRTHSPTTKATNATKTAKTKPAKATKHASSEHTTKPHALASAEDLTGTISLVSPADKTLTLLGANGVPYDFQITRKTQVELGHKTVAANELPGEEHAHATIHFVPTSRGNLAQSIRINAS